MDEEETVKGPFTQEEKKRLREAHVCVIGCGGLGGYVTEMLVRAGVGTITVSDGDVFDESNLTRQLYSVRESMGRNKAEEAGRRAAQIDPDVRLEAVPEYLTAENAGRILSGGSVCIDALDGFEDRALLEKICREKGMPMVHAGISGWCGEAGVLFPGAHLPMLGTENSSAAHIPVPSFVPAWAAAVEVSECIKILLGRETALKNRILYFDLLEGESRVFDLRKDDDVS